MATSKSKRSYFTMTWLITGGCGFVGTNLADELLSRGEEVVMLDNLNRVGSKRNLNWLQERHGIDWRYLEGDIRDADAVNELIRQIRPNALAHFAGQVAMTTSVQDPRLDFEVNALGTLNVLEAVRLYSPETIVLHPSTNKVYGDLAWVHYEEMATRYVATNYPNGFDETIPLNFHSPYGCSKGAADQYVLDYARMFGLRTVVFRHSSMYGGRQFATHDQGWAGWFCQKALEAQQAQRAGIPVPTFTISGDGKQVRDVLHAEDVVRLYASAVEHIDQAAGRAFNIGGGAPNSLSLLELFAFLEEALDIVMTYEQLPWRLGDQKTFVTNIQQARECFGWEPTISYSEGIKEMLGQIALREPL